ncbi:ATP-binding protein [Nocardioides eburneiflavus]|uniref:ATP-binding protein n=1 Tax=Nocardioides eburneiflavus TaxID=2518372 RepID=A0A4Z1CKU0_9ACTN|nr:ATP-binding protein [Nocardioides eburneiflavus]TGN65020.1 ATP-binding protein [Nocardioides eburneiflavus]
MRIRRIDIENFRGIKSASWRLPKDQAFFALIGPGDSTKTTLLTAIERTLHDRAGMTFADTDFYRAMVDEPIRVRVAVDDLPDELIAMDAFGAFLAGINDAGEWLHDPVDESERCVIVELLVEADLEPMWQSYRPPLDGGEDQDEETHPVRARHRARMTAYRIDDRVDAHLRWSTTSSLGKLTAKRGDTKATLTVANRAARDAAGAAVTDDLKILAHEVQNAVQAIGTAEFADLKPGLDMSLSNTRGNLALFEGDVPLTNFGLGTRRLTGAATQQLANAGSTTLLVDEVEHGLEPHRLVHLLGYLRNKEAFSQVFVTTHSPTALLHLEPQELIMVRSTASGTTEVRSLDDPASLRPLLKRCPEAFLSRRVVINEGKTEYGVVLRLLQEWDYGPVPEAVPSAALGVVALEGDGGTGSAKWAKEFLDVGYDVVLFIDSDEPDANAMVPDVQQLGGTVVQWPGGVCIETAVCSQLDEAGLNGYIAAALEVADDPAASKQSFTDHLRKYAVLDGLPPAGVEILDMITWTAAGISLDACWTAIALVSKEKGWFKRVDKGQRLGRFLLESASLQTGPVRATIDELKAAIYARPPGTQTTTQPARDGDQAQGAPQTEARPEAQQPEPTPEPPAAGTSADA